MAVSDSAGSVTQHLRAWGRGEESALKALVPLVYEELRRIARRYMRQERDGATLQTTALLNEAYLKLVKADDVTWRDRTHFYAVSARIMRRILVDAGRRRSYGKRGGGLQRVSLDEHRMAGVQMGADVVALDEALTALSDLDPRKARVVELRFFGGLSVEETAEVLGVSPQTVLRDWRLAKVWLSREIDRAGKHES